MHIYSAQFVASYPSVDKCPAPVLPEYAFIGRSNVGKSSLINKVLSRRNLAKTSSTPGKTQLINHFLINNAWYLVDLPGYGFAKVSKSKRSIFSKMIADYILKRPNLTTMFVLLDSRLPLQANDHLMIQWLGEHQIPFALVFTKLDKCKQAEFQRNFNEISKKLLTEWEALPPVFFTSADSGRGCLDLLTYIDQLNQDFVHP